MEHHVRVQGWNVARVVFFGSDASNQQLAQPTAATTGASEEPKKKAGHIFSPPNAVDQLRWVIMIIIAGLFALLMNLCCFFYVTLQTSIGENRGFPTPKKGRTH